MCNLKCAAALIMQNFKHKVLPFLFFICKIKLTPLHLICFVITWVVLCWSISLSFCAVLWKPHSFLTVIYNYHQRQVIFLPWSILLRFYAIVFIMVSGKQMECFVCMETIRNFWAVQGVGGTTLLMNQGAHHRLFTVWIRPEQVLPFCLFSTMFLSYPMKRYDQMT